MPSDVHTVYHFLDWRADPSEHRLSRNGEPVPITPRAMEVLAYLLERSGRVVSKEELLGAVWDGQAVTDDALVVTIYELRKALGDRARDPTYLETVVRRGYRFLPPVRASVAGTGPPPTVADPPAFVEPGHVVDPPGTPSFPQQRPDGDPRPFFRGLGALRIAAVLLFAGAAVAVALGMAPGPKEGRRLTPVGTGVDATEAPSRRSDDRVVDALLVRARRELDERSPASLERAETHYRRLLDLRGDDPRAHAGLARVAALRADLRLGDRFDLYHEARSRAERALARDGSLVDAHLALATTQFILDWDASAAARSLETCLSLEPGNPDVHQVRAWLFSAMGDHAAARRAAARAVSLDPESASRRADLAFVLVLGGDPAAALEEARGALVLDPEHPAAQGTLIRIHLALGDPESARRHHLGILRRGGWGPSDLADLEGPRDGGGYWPFLRRVLDRLSPETALASRAAAAAHLGELDDAVALLERAADRRDWEILWLEQLPELAPLRDLDRFQALLERRGSLDS